MLCAEKQPGETLNELMERVRKEHGISPHVRCTYAGRLDPLAEGVVLILVGNEVYEKETYTELPKTYITDILFGVGTDTHDPLGMITGTRATVLAGASITTALERWVGVHEQRYPAYSSKPHKGVPLFARARRGEVGELPTHRVELKKCSLDSVTRISGAELSTMAQVRVARVRGDFRQEEITEKWRVFGEDHGNDMYTLARISLSVGSGFYVRQLAADVGEALGTPALAWWIRRDAVGQYRIY